MKYLPFIFIFMLFLGCTPEDTQSSYPHQLYNNNNSIDGDLASLSPYQRIGNGKGVLGEWYRTPDITNRRVYIFRENGSLTIKQQIYSEDVFGNPEYTDNHVYNGTFSINSVENENDNVVFFKIPWYTADTEFQILVSDNFLVLKKYEGSPVEYEILSNGIEVKWFRDSVFAVRVDYGKTINSVPVEFKAVPINNNSQRNVVIDLPISELYWADIKVYSKKYWKYDATPNEGYYNWVRINFK